ncbi:hypothetical protein ACFWZ3_13675 [Frateuria sp. GZRR35]|uniref:hypothetical protein n=1 Tax=unclassified Frateuria TaxID=2648894 RepID=UPI003EDC00D0
MIDHDDFKTLVCLSGGTVPDNGFAERVMRRIRHRARRRRTILIVTTLLAICATAVAAWMFPARALAWDVRSTISLLLLAVASGLITMATETSRPAWRTPISR